MGDVRACGKDVLGAPDHLYIERSPLLGDRHCPCRRREGHSGPCSPYRDRATPAPPSVEPCYQPQDDEGVPVWISRALSLVERALESPEACKAVQRQTGGRAPEIVQGILDGIVGLYARAPQEGPREPKGCPTPGACSCVEPVGVSATAPEPEWDEPPSGDVPGQARSWMAVSDLCRELGMHDTSFPRTEHGVTGRGTVLDFIRYLHARAPAPGKSEERPVDCAACGVVPGPITDDETCPECGSDAWPAERRMDAHAPAPGETDALRVWDGTERRTRRTGHHFDRAVQARAGDDDYEPAGAAKHVIRCDEYHAHTRIGMEFSDEVRCCAHDCPGCAWERERER